MRKRWSVLGVMTVLGLAACNSDTTGPTDGVRFSMYLTDAPGDVRAWASFSDIYVEGEDGRQSLLTEPTELIELTALVGVVQELVHGADIPWGTGGQVRAVVDQAILEDGDGNAFGYGDPLHPEGTEIVGDLRCPSCSTSGLKVKLTDGSEEVFLDGAGASLLLDFDVAQSFAADQGAKGGWKMHPVILGTLTLGEASAETSLPTGMIQGTVQLPFFGFVPQCPPGTPRDLSSFVPTATMAGVLDDAGEPIVRTGSTSAAGSFEIPFLAAGDYELGQDVTDFGSHRLVFSTMIIPAFVSLAEDQAVPASYQILSMACEPTG